MSTQTVTYADMVSKMIGSINPIGKTEVDNERFENLKTTCELINTLVYMVDNVAYEGRDAGEFSVKRAAGYAKNFLTNTLGIKE